MSEATHILFSVGTYTATEGPETMNALPSGINSILEFLASAAAGYGNKLKWNEQAMLKADLMNVQQRWTGVSVAQVGARCQQLGMRIEDVDLIKDLITRAQAGRRLIAQRTYRDFRFRTPVDQLETDERLQTSREW